ncbi:MAG: hypothetical protein ABJL55_18285 [Roseibium sp.]
MSQKEKGLADRDKDGETSRHTPCWYVREEGDAGVGGMGSVSFLRLWPLAETFARGMIKLPGT